MGGNPMQRLPPQLELPEGDRFTLPTVSAVRELVPAWGQLPAHMVLMMICGLRMLCVDTVEKDREGPLIWPDVGRHPADSEAKEQLSFDRAER